MDIDELLNGLRGMDADTLGDMPGMVDQVAQYIGDLNTNSQAALMEVNQQLESQAAEIQRLQAENYKLMVAAGSAQGDDTQAESEPDPADEGGDTSDWSPDEEMEER